MFARQTRKALWLAAFAMVASVAPAQAAPAGNGDPAATARGADITLAEENAGKSVLKAKPLDDLPFLRRVYVDLIGRIPTDAEIQAYLATPANTRRQSVVNDLMNRDAFADRWAVFFGDLLRVRARVDGGAAMQAFVHEAIQQNMPYDELTRRLIAAAGKAGAQPETAFLLGDQADPMALTGVISQVFLGVRMQCAQCHDHPFDNWSQEEFYDMAAFFGKTRRYEQRINMRLLGVYLQEQNETTVKWPPEEKSKGKTRTAVEASFPFKLDEADGPNKHVARFTALRAKLAAEAEARAKAARDQSNVDDILEGASKKPTTAPDPLDVRKDNSEAVGKLDFGAAQYKASQLRKQLANHVTDPRNRYFSRSFVNRTWAELIGRGFVNPIDDFKDDNPPSHPRTLDYLADEFVASGYDFRFLVKTIVLTDTYALGHLPVTVAPPERMKAEQEFTAMKVRRLFSEALFDSVVSAGHLFQVKHPAGANKVVVTSFVRVPAGVIVDKVPEKTQLGDAKPAMAGMAGMQAMPAGGYDLERGIEVDFKSALKKREGLEVEAMKATSNEQLEAEMMSKMEPKSKNTRTKYVTKEVKTEIDDNPYFNSSMKIASPAPIGHFLRVFGQTDRTELDDKRDHTPSMRQALMMLNGKLTNEAARVGPLEPMYKLLVGPKADLDKAIHLAYREILTREPSQDEIADAKEIIAGGTTVVDGMADLRWALFNCNEFRYLP